MSKLTIIVSGGVLDEELTLESLKNRDEIYVIGVDHGVEFLYSHQITPDYIVGDFDSLAEEIIAYYRTETKVPIREFNPVKDATDTEIALRLALSIGSKKIVILGATGRRIDHLWGNVQILSIAHEAGVEAEILDPLNRIRMIGPETILNKAEAFGPYFSVFAMGGEVRHFNITGAKYPLQNHTLTASDSLCVSNQFAEDEVVITFPEGMVILMETRD